MRYGPFILNLDDREIYAVDTVVEAARKKGLFRRPPYNEVTYGEARRKAFDALSKFRKKNMPDEPDGRVMDRHQVPTDGWYGWRWKRALPHVFQQAYEFPEQPPVESEAQTDDREEPREETETKRHKFVLPGFPVLVPLALMGLTLFFWFRSWSVKTALSRNRIDIARLLDRVREDASYHGTAASELRRNFLAQTDERLRHQYYQALKDLEELGTADDARPRAVMPTPFESWGPVDVISLRELP
ncbi:MAG: hypothetical protein QNK37_18690 [Acidobacteriota bacterium]|nr:hypothetical protein [Acidobacteriota bacterium]